ncbi:hypothetical protein HY408_00575 [Candidatus Gottesmanbacteria bacterium]|nr:hypothetical protein [Candidatus Gottesmanbacteria bacterium]
MYKIRTPQNKETLMKIIVYIAMIISLATNGVIFTLALKTLRSSNTEVTPSQLVNEETVNKAIETLNK